MEPVVKKKPTLLWIAALAFFPSFQAMASSKTSRIYHVNPAKPNTPVKIEPIGASGSGGLVLRDPILKLDEKARSETLPPAHKPPRAEKRKAHKPIKMTRIRISGELTNPRLQFKAERIERSKLDEPISFSNSSPVLSASELLELSP